MHKAFAALDPPRQGALHEEMLALLARFDRGGRGGLAVPGDYLEVVVTKQS